MALEQYDTAPDQYKAFQQKMQDASAQASQSASTTLPQPQDDTQSYSPPTPPDVFAAMANQLAGNSMGSQGSILGAPAQLTQQFGNINPDTEVFSNGFNSGADFGVPLGTKIALPPGQWNIVSAYSGAKGPGRIGDNTNYGYGNSVLAENAQTGEKLRFSHLSQVGVQPGQSITGGNVIGLSGMTGNASGPHVDLEYYDKNGQLNDVLKSVYSKYLNMSK